METAATEIRASDIRPNGDSLGTEVRGVDITSGLGEAELERIRSA